MGAGVQRGYGARMNRSSEALHVSGLVGLVGGTILVLAGVAMGPELGGMVTSYGMLVVLAAGYLLIGLRVRRALQRRTAPTRSHASAVGPSRT